VSSVDNFLLNSCFIFTCYKPRSQYRQMSINLPL
jgi:hypothetical protein